MGASWVLWGGLGALVGRLGLLLEDLGALLAHFDPNASWDLSFRKKDRKIEIAKKTRSLFRTFFENGDMP